MLPAQWHKYVRIGQIRIVFQDLIFKNEMITKRIPRQFSDHPMILVVVGPVMRQDQIRIEALHRLEGLLDIPDLRGEEPVAVIVDSDFCRTRLAKEGPGATPGLLCASGGGGQNDPKDPASRVLFQQRQDRAARTDLDVIRVRAQAE